VCGKQHLSRAIYREETDTADHENRSMTSSSCICIWSVTCYCKLILIFITLHQLYGFRQLWLSMIYHKFGAWNIFHVWHTEQLRLKSKMRDIAIRNIKIVRRSIAMIMLLYRSVSVTVISSNTVSIWYVECKRSIWWTYVRTDDNDHCNIWY
jgi:hypothetical protein